MEEELHRYATSREAEGEMSNLLAVFAASNAKLIRAEFQVREGLNGTGEAAIVLSQICWFT